MTLILSSHQTCFERVEKEKVFLKDVEQQKWLQCGSMTFYELLCLNEFEIKGMQTNQQGSVILRHSLD
jgi:hypothetical protein